MAIQDVLGRAPEIAGEILDDVCAVRAQSRANAGAAIMPVPASSTMPGGPGSVPTPPPSVSGCASGLPAGLLQAHGVGCPGIYTKFISEVYQRKCQMVCDPCWLWLLDQSIGRQSWPMVRNQVGLTYIKFNLTGYTASNQPTPDPDSNATTTFVANVPVAAGESILLRQMLKYTLPWRPGCLKLTLGFSAGDMANNMTHVQVKVYVMRRGNYQPTGNIQSFLVPWNPDEWYTGDQFRCGDNCAEVQITGTLGCGTVEHVGDDNELFFQVYNDAAATNSITAINATVSLAGLTKACCNSCASGGGKCSCGG